MITSVHNPRVQWVRKLQTLPRQRAREGRFVVEGIRLSGEALSSDWEAHLVLFTRHLDARGHQIVAGFAARGVPAEEVSEAVMTAVSATQTPQGLLVVLSIRQLPLPRPLDFVFIPDQVRDPGNLGSMLRTAASAGAGAAFLPTGTTDAYAPKVVRAAMGAHFRLPIQAMNWKDIAGFLTESALQTYLADARGGVDYTLADFCRPLALIVGGEAEGAGEAAEDIATARVHIPMPGGMESLNAAVAAGVLLFEVVRQRRGKARSP